MILSVSRRTDIPNYYSEWFYNRIKEGFLYVRNPMNAHQISEIKITPDVVDCIVFWTKNPLPMMKRLNEIKDYNYYFQFTLTGYGNDVEVNLPNKKAEMIPVFQELSEKIGKQKVIWRYDPIFFSDRYTKEYHLKAFKSIAEALSGYTEKCVISFVDIYPKNKKNMDGLSSYELNDDELREFAEKLSKIAADNNIKIGGCAEKIDLDECGIIHNCCIDREYSAFASSSSCWYRRICLAIISSVKLLVPSRHFRISPSKRSKACCAVLIFFSTEARLDFCRFEFRRVQFDLVGLPNKNRPPTAFGMDAAVPNDFPLFTVQIFDAVGIIATAGMLGAGAK